jgi:hypothetical protein
MPPAGFEHSIPASERSQAHTLDRAASRIEKYSRNFVVPTSRIEKMPVVLSLGTNRKFFFSGIYIEMSIPH